MPSESGVGRVYGEGHATKGRPVKWHWKVEPASFEAKAKVGVESPVVPTGPAVIVHRGRDESVVKALKVV